MLDVLGSLAVLLVLAWLGRSLLDARELGWGRLLLAALAGVAVGDGTAVLLVMNDISDLRTIGYQELQPIAFPFRVIGTMGAIVVLELLFRRRRGAGKVAGVRGRQLGKRRSILSPAVLIRAVQVSRVLAKHGLAPLALWGSGRLERIDATDLARRTRLVCEEVGGTFIKLGQLLATRPDLLPPAALAELSKLQSKVAPVGREAIEAEIRVQLGSPSSAVFSTVAWPPLGSASIAQVHVAELQDGTEVVVKVRRPGLERVIDRDLAIFGWLARTAEARFAWAEQLGITRLAREFADDLRAELDFEVEATHVDEIRQAVADEPLLKVPRVYSDLTRPGLLVLERLNGTPLASLGRDQSFGRSEELADALCTSQVNAMLGGERFHGDPHPGNVLLLDDGRLGIIDMGLSGKLDAFERSAVLQMLVALRHEQPALLLESMVTIGAVDVAAHDLDAIERELARFMAAYLGPGLPPARALTDLLRLTLDLGLRLPPSTGAMFRALATLMGTLDHIHSEYPVIDKIAELGGDEVKRRLLPGSAAEFVRDEWNELAPILARLPRRVDRLAAMVEHGRISTRTRVLADSDDRRFLERMLNRFVLTLLSVGTGAVSVALIGTTGSIDFPWFAVGLYEVLGWIGLFIAMTLMFRVLLAVLRSDNG